MESVWLMLWNDPPPFSESSFFNSTVDPRSLQRERHPRMVWVIGREHPPRSPLNIVDTQSKNTEWLNSATFKVFFYEFYSLLRWNCNLYRFSSQFWFFMDLNHPVSEFLLVAIVVQYLVSDESAEGFSSFFILWLSLSWDFLRLFDGIQFRALCSQQLKIPE